MTPIKIGNKNCGAGRPVFIAMEIGATLTEFDSALHLLDAASAAGVDALKVQILNPDKLVGDPAIRVAWTNNDGRLRSATMLEILNRRVLAPEEWATLATATHAKHLAFIATVDFPDTLELACRIEADALKACSGDINNLAWLAEMAKRGLPMMIDTGHATIGEIERAVDTIVAAGNEQIVIHIQGSGYPTRLEAINLQVITTLKQLFPECVIAFSDHSVGHDMDVAAVALGAAMVEKTLTLDRTQDGPEHVMSVEPQEAAIFVQSIRALEIALGCPRRILTDAERSAKQNARRSLYAGPHGTFEWRRPGSGIEPPDLERIPLQTLKSTHQLPAGHRIMWEDLL